MKTPRQASSDAGSTPSGAWLTPPVGTRDLLPPEAGERRALSRALSEVFFAYGYSLVTTPPFERIDVLSRVGTLEASDVLQFVDSDTGEVAMFRPDITPQIARLVATRMRERPAPYRLAYEGQVIRQRRGRARRQRQIAQCGLECIGLPGAEGETEIIEIAVKALTSIGLLDFRVELALVPLARRLLLLVPADRRLEATEALARKDASALRSVLARGPAKTRDTLVSLVDLFGDRHVLREATRALAGHPASVRDLASLRTLVSALERKGLGELLDVDLGEVRGFGYYTGPSFSLLADGPGEPLGGGGRYDDLMARFGHAAPGAGFALDLENVAWALERARGPRIGRPDIDLVLFTRSAHERASQIAETLRVSGLRVSMLGALSRDEAKRWATAWSVPFVAEVTAKTIALEPTAGDTSERVLDADALASLLQGRFLSSLRRTSDPAESTAPRRAAPPSAKGTWARAGKRGKRSA